MKVYVDLIIFLNFFFDFILLLTTSIVLKRRTSIKRIVLGSLLGSITIIVLFVPLTTLTLFLLKVFLSVLIILITFGYSDFKYFITNLVYFYLISIILGGFIYYLNVSFSYKNIGMVFFHKGISINYIFILICTPIIMYIYYKQMKVIREINSLYYKVDIYINESKLELIGYMDTGNTLIDPYTNRPVIITNSKKFESIIKNTPFFYIPYQSINEGGLLRCYKVKKIFIEGIGVKKNIVVGVVKDKLKSNKVEVLLNYLLMEG